MFHSLLDDEGEDAGSDSETENPGSSRARIVLCASDSLEEKLQPELQNARIVGGTRAQQAVRQAAIWVTSVQVDSIATHRAAPAGERTVPASRTCTTGNVAPLGMVKAVERFRAELKRTPFVNSKMLKDRHIEVSLTGVPSDIPR